MGQAHSRGCRRAPSYFPDRNYEPELVVVSDTVAVRGEEAVRSFGFATAVDDWRQVVEHDDVDVVFVTAPNMLHVEMVEAAAANGKHVFCEKPVGGTPAQTVAAERATRRAGVISGVGYNYRWAPLVQYAKQLVDSGEIGEITNYYGRFFSMYGSDPLGVLSWRFLVDQAGHGVSTDILSHSVDLAHFLIGGVAGPITRVVGTGEIFIKQRPVPTGGRHALRPREPGRSDWRGHQRGLHRHDVRLRERCPRHVRGVSLDGRAREPEPVRDLRHPGFDPVELRADEPAAALHRRRPPAHRLHRPCTAATAFRTTATSCPGRRTGSASRTWCASRTTSSSRRSAPAATHVPGFAEAVAYVSVQDAVLRSWESGKWEDVHSLREDDT